MSPENNENIKYLSEALAHGDKEAFRSIFLLYFPRVKEFISHLLKDRYLAEDLSQDIFIKLWESRENAISIQNLNAYIYRMARNVVINEIKKIDTKNKYIVDKQNISNQDFPSLESEILAQETMLLIELIVNKMPNQRRTIYNMSRVDGLKNEEIAQQLNITKKTVENHLNLALKEIRKTISLFIVFFI